MRGREEAYACEVHVDVHGDVHRAPAADSEGALGSTDDEKDENASPCIGTSRSLRVLACGGTRVKAAVHGANAAT